MLRRVLVGGLVLIVVVLAGVFVWARSVLSGDGVRTAIAAQLTDALGQPVQVGRASVTNFPRITLTLGDVAIGEPTRIHAQELHVGTDFRALLSRRIEHAALRVTGAHVELPLPAFPIGGGSASTEASDGMAPPVELVSVDAITVDDLELTSGGRTLRGSLAIVPQGDALEIRRFDLDADGETIAITGTITDVTRPSGALTITAPTLSFDELVQFASDFTSGADLPDGAAAASGSMPETPASGSTPDTRAAASTPGTPAAADASGLDLALDIDAGRATFGTLALTDLAGQARLTPAALTFDTVHFGLFGGTCDGSLSLALGDRPAFHLDASLTDVDMGAAMAFAGAADAVTGRLSGRLDLTGRGMRVDTVLDSLRGTARVDLVDGRVKGLGLVRGVVVATSMRGDATTNLASTGVDEPFSRLGATLTVTGPVARTSDVRFESDDLLLSAGGTIGLAGDAVDLEGQLQLSEALSQQAGRDLVRYTREDGKVTLPATVTGAVDALQVRIDLADLARRAITNRAEEEAAGAIKRGLGGLFGR